MLKMVNKLVTSTTVQVYISQSKSYFNRALIIASCIKGKTELTNIANLSEDITLMIECLKKLGIKIEKTIDSLIIYGNGGKFKKPEDGILNCGIAGTTSRFIVGLSVLFDFDIIITAEGKMLERPMDDLIDAMKLMDIDIENLGKTGCLPIKISGNKIIKKHDKKENLIINGSKSSQFITSLLMVSPLLSLKKIYIKDDLVSKSYIDITIDIMRNFGVNIENKNYKEFNVLNNGYKAKTYNIESDWSSASYFIAAGIFSNNHLDICGLNLESVQGDAKFLEAVRLTGVKIEKNKDFIRIFGSKNIKPIKIDMSSMPDTAMTMAILLAFADGKSKISGLATLKDKECNRLGAMYNEFSKIGIKTEIGDDFIEIYGNPNLEIKKPTEIETYHDHRIAMSFAALGMKTGNILIKNPEVVGKSFSNFWKVFNSVYG